MIRNALMAVGGTVLACACAVAQTARPPEETEAVLRPGAGAGMGVSYVNPFDVTDYIGGLTGTRVSDFSSAVEFFGTVGVPVSDDWVVAVEYAYLLGGFSGVGGGGEFTMKAHMPTLIVQYAAIREERYNVRLGAGAGYHAGTLAVRYVTLNSDYTGSGPAFKLDVEANTALGDDLFARLGVDARWEFIGRLTDSEGGAIPAPPGTQTPTLHMFSVGAKLGMTWYF